MKIQLSWKDPDWYFGLDRQVPDPHERADVIDLLYTLGAGEYLDVEFDTEAKTATVSRPPVLPPLRKQ